jgi:2-(1,2-epoxy-1,2-dihydrophenyl)acetyl-CoA isomerase
MAPPTADPDRDDRTPVKLAWDGALAHVLLDRPQAGNALDLTTAEALHAAARDVAAAGDQIGAVLVTGAGPNFCVGGDLREFGAAADPTAHVRAVARQIHAALRILTELPAPVVTAVQGAVAGGGVGLALAGDLVVAARTARFRLAYTAGGLSPDCGGSWVLPRLVGLPRAMYLALANPVLPAEQAESWGLVSLVVDDDELVGRARDLAERLARGPRRAQAATKRLLRSAAPSFGAHLDDEADTIAHLAGTPDGREGIRAFLDKRAPSFDGTP